MFVFINLLFISFGFILTANGRSLPGIQLKNNDRIVGRQWGLEEPGIGSGQWSNLVDDEDDEEFTTVKGPGHEGILTGLSGILSNLVSGNANGIVESTFNFVPPVYQKSVNSAYGTIIGRPTTKAPSTTSSTLNSESIQKFQRPGAGTKVTEVVDEEVETTRPKKVNQNQKIRPPQLPVLSTGDDEEDEERIFVNPRNPQFPNLQFPEH